MNVGNPWTIRNGAGRIVATAIHDGHDLRPEVADAMALGDAERLREEDPFTGQAVLDVPAHIVVHRSRFEFDLNRGYDGAVLNPGAWTHTSLALADRLKGLALPFVEVHLSNLAGREEFREGVGKTLANPVVFGSIRGVFKRQNHHHVGCRILGLGR